LSLFSVPAALRCGHRGPPGPHRSDTSKHRIELGYTVLNRHSEVVPVVSFFFTGTHRGAKQRRFFPRHHRSSSGLNRISTVRPPGDTVANRHEMCSWWRYGDSRFGNDVLRKRAGSCQSNYGLARWQPVNASKIPWRYGVTTE